MSREDLIEFLEDYQVPFCSSIADKLLIIMEQVRADAVDEYLEKSKKCCCLGMVCIKDLCEIADIMKGV